MERKCPKLHCWAPELGCNMGEEELDKCPHWRTLSATDQSRDHTDGRLLLPWSGNSFGIVDLQFVAGRSRPFVVGVVGPHNAGKTTLLTTVYLLLEHGRQLSRGVFAGSYTLGGWENLAHTLRWQPGQIPGFPPHTPRNAGRMPGLLHLALRRADDVVEDVLFTDASGEWFDRWAIDRNAPDGAGARWISRYADAFMLFADRAALAGSQLGQARTQLQQLAHRLSDEVAQRPVAVVWAKSDIPIGDTLRSSLQQRFDRLFPISRAFDVTIQPGAPCDEASFDAILTLVDWLLERPAVRHRISIELPVEQSDDPFLAYRGS